MAMAMAMALARRIVYEELNSYWALATAM